MEFEGRIKKVLELRKGTSSRTGNEWQALPFVFEYFEHETDRYADSVLLETFDAKVIPHLKEGMEVRCGFSHRTREYEGRTYNEVRLYKIESVKKAEAVPLPTQQPVGETQGLSQAATQEAPKAEDDGLPF